MASFRNFTVDYEKTNKWPDGRVISTLRTRDVVSARSVDEAKDIVRNKYDFVRIIEVIEH